MHARLHLRSRRVLGSGVLGVAAGLLAGSTRSRCSVRPATCEGGRGASEPTLRFGAVADVQFADVDDAWNFRGTQKRRYRGALGALRSAVQDWLQGPSLTFIADLGDIIDQQCETNNDSCRALDLVLKEWEPAPSPVFHLIGNHELYNFNREQLAKLIPGIAPWYRSFRPVMGWRVLILDAYDVNIIEKDEQSAEEGFAYLGEHNPNDLRAPRGTVDLAKGLVGLARRYVPMAGAMKAKQLAWVAEELAAARMDREQTIIMIHVPFFPPAAVPGALLWNYDELLDVVRSADSGAVPLVLAGHYHDGGYAQDEESGTHHVTLASPLNAPESNPTAHATVEVWPDRIEIKGSGIVESRTLQLRPPAWTAEAVGSRL
eukprot:TRINITY_DN32567_c0_g1_i1.p1 TRINITY_DN32567_c0_g1~~TRINITY_DN32567_c0_g1_i1.p1  ORF type:complete len:374 (-),score=63.44 TRINITY_DN32567_c0_g1_i1:57-1178(-)